MIRAMDLTPRTTTTTTSTPTITMSKSPPSHDSDTDIETPLQTQLTKALSLTNGWYHPSPAPAPAPAPALPQMVVSYKECLKNHAASLGGLALDGCGEFMPTPTSTPLDPCSLKCAACGCHRNFHRRYPHGGGGPSTTFQLLPPPPPPLLQPPALNSSRSPSPASPLSATPQQSVYPASAPHMLLALSSGGHDQQCKTSGVNPKVMMINPHGRKRARTKFTEEQKEKMHVFAEKLGWKMLRGSHEDKMVDEFCTQIGVKRKVFKVWMHNNKNRKEKGNNTSNGDDEGRVLLGLDTNGSKSDNSIDKFQIIDRKDHVLSSTDGSSPSS